jgi:ankyrin repeat protein
MEDLDTDLLTIIFAYLNDEAINVMSVSASKLNNKILEVQLNPLFWKEHTEVLLNRKLKDRYSDWRKIYIIIVGSIKNNNPFIPIIEYYTDNADAVEVLIEADYNPSLDNNKAIVLASKYGQINTVIALLKDSRVDPSVNNGEVLINAIKARNTQLLKILLENPRIDPSIDNNKAIVTASEIGYQSAIELLLKDKRINPFVIGNNLIAVASENGHTAAVEILIRDAKLDPSADDNKAIQSAARNGQFEVVRILIQDPRVDPSANNNAAVQFAVFSNHPRVVKLLLQDPRVNPANENSLQVASRYGYIEVVKLLLEDPRIDPSNMNNSALRNALEYNRIDVATLLLQDPRVDVFNGKLLSQYPLIANEVKLYIDDSLSGLAAMYFVYRPNNNIDIYRSRQETVTNVEGLYHQFLRYLVRKKPSMIQVLKMLTTLIKSMDNDSKLIMRYAAKDVLNPNIKFNFKQQLLDYYFAFMGFLMLVYKPQYTYQEIFDILSQKGASIDAIYLAAKLIGAYLGLDNLIMQGLKINKELRDWINSILDINLMDLAN